MISFRDICNSKSTEVRSSVQSLFFMSLHSRSFHIYKTHRTVVEAQYLLLTSHIGSLPIFGILLNYF